jgi:predicted amidohydrolase YtcJ
MLIIGDKIAELSEFSTGGRNNYTDSIVVDLGDLTVLPGFVDTHTHLLQAAYSVFDVQIDQARSIPYLINLIRERATTVTEGTWIRTSAAWHEMNLAERRAPTAKELDEATTRHPVLVKRGGHADMVNSIALKIAGITPSSISNSKLDRISIHNLSLPVLQCSSSPSIEDRL